MRIPVAPEHRHLAWIAFGHNGQKVVAQHTVMPFGALASVYHWDRLGELLKTIARCSSTAFARACFTFVRVCRRLLKLPVLRFVDDFFAVERAGFEKAAMLIFARWRPCVCALASAFLLSLACVRLVRCLLGSSAIADRKLEHGNPLVVLGIAVNLADEGISFRPEPVKVQKWLTQVTEALRANRLTGGEASKLAGASSFSPPPVSCSVSLLQADFPGPRSSRSSV